jgi:hypothetical protein
VTIVGPGSEWFWAAAQFVLVAVSLVGIYRQLKAQGSANAFQRLSTLHERWDSERLVRARLQLAIRLRHGPADKVGASVIPVADFFEDIALLEAAGHVSRREVWLDWNRTVEFWWALVEPEIRRRRADYPGDFDGFETLRDRMVDLDRREGRENVFEPATIRRMLDDVIVALRERLQDELDAREGRLPEIPPDPAT